MDASAMYTRIRNRLGATSADEMVADAKLLTFLNDAVDLIVTEMDGVFLETSASFNTVAGTGTQAAPSGWMRTISLQIDTYEPMVEHTKEELDARWSDASLRGRPYEYAVRGSTIHLRPIPDAVYAVTHAYVGSETDMASGTDTPTLAAPFHHVVVEYATHLAAMNAGMPDAASAAMDRFDRGMAALRRTIAAGRPPLVVQVRPGGWFD